MTRSFFLAALSAIALCGCTLDTGSTASSLYPKNAALKNAGGPLVQAHRGSRGEYEDTAAGGFKWCLDRGVRGFEVDIRFTKDRRLIVMHDSTVDRTTDGTGAISDYTYEELLTDINGLYELLYGQTFTAEQIGITE